ncbi:MAG: hypothetical protein ACE37K_02900 [Planctomycetota bacterium]
MMPAVRRTSVLLAATLLTAASTCQDRIAHADFARLRDIGGEAFVREACMDSSMRGLRTTEDVQITLAKVEHLTLSHCCHESLTLARGSVLELAFRNLCAHRNLRLGPRVEVRGDLVIENVKAETLVISDVRCHGAIELRNVGVGTLLQFENVECSRLLVSGVESRREDARLLLKQVVVEHDCKLDEIGLPIQKLAHVRCRRLSLQALAARGVEVRSCRVSQDLHVDHQSQDAQLSLRGSSVQGRVILALGAIGDRARVDLGRFRGGWGDTPVDHALVAAVGRGTGSFDRGPALRRIGEELKSQGRTGEYLVVQEAVAWHELDRAQGLSAKVASAIRWFRSGQGRDIRILLSWIGLFLVGLVAQSLILLVRDWSKDEKGGVGILWWASIGAVAPAIVGVFPVRIDHWIEREFHGAQVWIIIVSQLLTWLLILLFVGSVISAAA